MGSPKRRDVKDRHGRIITRCLVYPTGVFDLKHTIYRGLGQFLKGPVESGAWLPGTLILPREITDEAYCRELTAEVCVDPRQQAKGNARRRLHDKPGDHRIWVKRSGWANEALDIAVGCRALAWAAQVDTMGPVQWDRLRARLAPPEGVADLFTAARERPPADDAMARLAAYNNGA
jgi:phage terminase large subunit GpA-like protein